MAGIMDIKYQNIVIEMMVERCDEVSTTIAVHIRLHSRDITAVSKWNHGRFYCHFVTLPCVALLLSRQC